jgi:hypothetical protein
MFGKSLKNTYRKSWTMQMNCMLKGNDPAPKRIPLGGPPYCLEYLLRLYTKWHTDFLIDDMEDAKEWFEDLTGEEPEYEEFKEALTHYKRAFKRLSDLSL